MVIDHQREYFGAKEGEHYPCLILVPSPLTCTKKNHYVSQSIHFETRREWARVLCSRVYRRKDTHKDTRRMLKQQVSVGL